MELNNILKKLSVGLFGLNYCLIGAANLFVQGVKVVPRDIDILTDEKTIYEIAERLKQFQIKPIYFDETEGRNSYQTFFKIDGFEIEVLGNVNNACRPLDSLDKKVKIKFADFEINCMPLEEELKAYGKMERKDKVELIKKYLKN